MKTRSLVKPPESKILKSSKVTLSPGKEIGEHTTNKREEFLIILKGTATLSKEDKVIELKQGETHYIKENIKHNIKNNSNDVLEYIYVVSLFE